MPDFTQGQWEAQNWDADRWAVFDKTGITVADCFNNEANARLIAAAPDMYAFIKAVRELFIDPDADQEGLSFKFIPDAAKQLLDIIDGREALS